MKQMIIKLFALLFAGIVIGLSIWGPEVLTRYRDKGILNEIHEETAEISAEGYRYTLSSSEKLFILSKSLDSQTLQEDEPIVGTYAFIVNHNEPSEKEISGSEIYQICNRELMQLAHLGILSSGLLPVTQEDYHAQFYSAIDVLEPRNNVAVWKVSLSDDRKILSKENRLMEAYIDADSGRIYEFYVRSERLWEEMEPDKMIKEWSSYMQLPEPVLWENTIPLMETTPYFQKYLFDGQGEEKMVVTVGFYEGINEGFLKVSK